MISRLAVSGYRSLRDVKVALAPLSVVTGANGSGKSSLYRALRLLADIAQGRVIESLASEGGLQSALWAGPEIIGSAVKRRERPLQGTVRKAPVSLRLGFAGETFGYAIDVGLPSPSASMFCLDPAIKAEAQWVGEKLERGSVFATREGALAQIRDARGAWRHMTRDLSPVDSMMTHCADPHSAPELLTLREQMRAWRFYDHFRTDREAPARRPQIGTYTPALDSEGVALAAALQTIREVGDREALDATVADAFPGAGVGVRVANGYFEVEMRQEGLLRPLRAAELSDGTLRYLLLAAALLSPRPPPVLILNEPETSLHPSLLAPLARLVSHSASRSQVIVVSHAPGLVTPLQAAPGCQHIVLDKAWGETAIQGGSAPAWSWPSR